MSALALLSPKVSSAKPVERDLGAFQKLPSKTAIQTANQIDRREAFQPIIKRNLRIEVALKCTEDVHTLRPDFVQAQNGCYIFASYFIVNLPETDLFQYSIKGIDVSYSRSKREFFFSKFIEECPLFASQQDDFVTDGHSLIIARKYLDSRELGHESDEAVEGAVIASHQIPPPQRHKAEVELSLIYDGKIPLKPTSSISRVTRPRIPYSATPHKFTGCWT